MIYVVFMMAAVLIVILYGWIVYNRITRLTNVINEAWANIAASVQMRHDTIPYLVNIAKGSKDYELSVQKSQAALRSQDIQKLNDAERHLQKEMLAIIETYPDVKADATFKKLFDKIVVIENDIQGNRLLFNRAVALYRRELASFPAGVFAIVFGFTKLDFFEVDPSRLN